MIQFLFYAGTSAFLFALAEGLTRKAFPSTNTIMENVASVNAGNSIQVLRANHSGYLMLGIDFAYSIGFYYLALKFWGWWSPSEALYNPDTLQLICHG